MIAQKIGQETLLPSLQLALEDPGANSSNCGEGYSCAYTNSISWSSPTQPLPMELDPQVVFERLFGDGRQRRRNAPRAASRIAAFWIRSRRACPLQEGSGRRATGRGWTNTRPIFAKSSAGWRSRRRPPGQVEHRWRGGSRRAFRNRSTST